MSEFTKILHDGMSKEIIAYRLNSEPDVVAVNYMYEVHRDISFTGIEIVTEEFEVIEERDGRFFDLTHDTAVKVIESLGGHF